jgi:dienelactone hydrolase
MVRLAVLLLPVALSAQGPLLEEDLQKSRPHREQGYRQLEQYVKQLPAAEVLRQQFRTKIGFPPPGFTQAPAMRCEPMGEDAIATYSRCWVTVAAGLETYGLYLVPKNRQGPTPLVVSLHGGGGFPEMALFHGGANYHDQLRGAVREGYIVWAPQFVMYPYRDRDTSTPIPSEVRAELDLKLRNAGTSLMALESMKVIRSLDAVLQRPEVDARRVAMIGLSFGGYYSLYIAALDPRIHVVVASGCFREAPLVRETVMGGRPIDLTSPQQVALIAPRPLQIQTGVTDAAAPIESVRRTLAEARVYHPTLDYQEFDGGHEWRGDIAWTFLRQHLRK